MIDANGYVTTTTNDDLYRPVDVSVEYAHGSFGITHTVYDAVGNATSVTDPLGKVTLMDYDALNRVVKTTFHDDVANSNVTTSTTYSQSGLKWKVTDELGRDTISVFDTAGRPVQVQAPPLAAGAARATTQMAYDNNGNVVTTTDPLGRQTDVTYDARNRKVRVAGPGVVVDYATPDIKVRPLTDTAYDAVGNVISVTDPRNSITTMEYDEANRKTKVTAPVVPVASQLGSANPATTTEYDPAGNALRVTDANGHITVNTYDAMNRLLTTTVHANTAAGDAGITVSNAYDVMGNRVTVTDGNLQSTSFTYDGLKRNISSTDALGHTTSFSYNAVNKTGRTDALNQVTSYTYDYRHRLIGVRYADHPSVDRAYAYDAAGRPLSVTEPGKGGKADVSYGYDAMNRVVSETSGGVMHLYEYDLAGNRIKTTYGGAGRVLNSTYDALNRLNTVVEGVVPGGRTTRYQYDLSGNVLRKILPNGDFVDTTYDALSRSATISGTSTAPNRADQPLYHYTQAHDAGGNVVAIAEQTADLAPRFLSMGYDGLDRLVSENELTGGLAKTTTYGYDKNNNRASRTIQDATGIKTTSYTYDVGNRLTGFTESTQGGQGLRSVTYAYNDAGSRISRTENGAVAAYNYDEEQRLVGLSQAGQTYAYTYDYRTRRVERVEGTSDTKVVFSGGTSVQELVGNAPVVEYIRGSDWGGGVGGILYTVRGGMASFTHYDSRGDVTAKTDTNGAVTYQASYESFGQHTLEQGSTADRQKANTKEEDPSGLLNEGMRYRDLESGTFITADPAGFVDGPNLYAYVRQNPWTKFDPEGLAESPAKLYKVLTGLAMRGERFAGKKVTVEMLEKEFGSSQKLEALKLWEKKCGKVNVSYTAAGEIDVSAHKIATANIGQFSREAKGSGEDLEKAWAQLKAGQADRKFTDAQIQQLQEVYTWHHTGVDGQLELVPKVINDAFPHTGGAAFARAGVFGKKALAAGVGLASVLSSTVEAATSEHPSAEKITKGVILDASKEAAAAKMALDGWLAVGRHMMQSLENQAYGPPGEDDEYEKYRTK